MSKRIDELAFKYNIDARTDELSLFVSEIYDDGFHAGKQSQQAFNTKIMLRDHFAGLAMQGLIVSPTMGDPDLHDSARELIKDITESAYEFADAMLKEKWLAPPKREPLSDIRCPYPEETRGEYRDGFTAGMLHAEKAHGIGVDKSIAVLE